MLAMKGGKERGGEGEEGNGRERRRSNHPKAKSWLQA
jgi:hypothetical protein